MHRDVVPFQLRPVASTGLRSGPQFKRELEHAMAIAQRYMPEEIASAVALGTRQHWAGLDGADKNGHFLRTADGKMIAFDSLAQPMLPNGYKRPVSVRPFSTLMLGQELKKIGDRLSWFDNRMNPARPTVILRRLSCIVIRDERARIVLADAAGGHEGLQEIEAVQAEFPQLFALETTAAAA